MNIAPITLEGRFARLEPLELRHAPGLLEAADDEAIWTHLPLARPQTLPDAQNYIVAACRQTGEPSQLPFAIIDRASGAFAGSTRYLEIRPAQRGIEIGWTWLGARYQRTALNTECKLLLLAHAFEVLGAIRVQLKTDILNVRSQRAIERLGAIREGLLRAHMIRRDGTFRDSVLYSILAGEWPAVRRRLEALLALRQPPDAGRDV